MTEYYLAKLDQKVVVEKDTDGAHYFIPGNKFPYNKSHFEWISEKPLIPTGAENKPYIPEIYDIQCDQWLFEYIRTGKKRFHAFKESAAQISDRLNFMQYSLERKSYTGNCLLCEITYVELYEDFTIFGFKLI